MLAFIALVLIGMLGGGDEQSSAPSSSSSSAPSPSTSTSASDGGGDPAADEESAASDTTPPATPAGVSAETDQVIVTVVSTDRTQELQDSLWESSTDNEYFVVDIEYTNTSDEPQDLWASDITLLGADGKKYSSNTDVSLALEDPLIIEEVNPDLTISGTLVFEVPMGAEFSELRLEKGYSLSEDVVITFE